MTSTDKTRTRTPRHAAGEDPDKRAAILAGAAHVFLQTGFDATSVNDICRAAGVPSLAASGGELVPFPSGVTLRELNQPIFWTACCAFK